MADTVADDQDVLDDETTGEVVEESAGQKPETLTREQVQQLLDERDRRLRQSMLDSFQARLNKTLSKDRQVADVKKKHNLTDEALQELRGALGVTDDEPKESEEAAKPDRKAEAGPTDEQVNATAQRLYAKYGISGEDPEAELIDVSGTAEDFIESIIHAGRTRQARLKQGATEQRRSPARAPGLAPAGGRAQERASGKSKSDLLEAEIDRMFAK